MSAADVEQVMYDIIDRRLQASNGSCMISVRSLAKTAGREIGLVKHGAKFPRELYLVADELLRKEGGILSSTSTGGTKYNGQVRALHASKVYAFNQEQGCADCEGEHLNPVKLPGSLTCASCGRDLSQEVAH